MGKYLNNLMVSDITKIAMSEKFPGINNKEKATYLYFLLDADENLIAPRHLLYGFNEHKATVEQTVRNLEAAGIIDVMRDGIHILVPPEQF